MSVVAQKYKEGEQVPQRPSNLVYFLKSNAFIQILIAATFLLVWEGSARLFNTHFWTSSPSAVILELKRWGASGLLATDLQLTLMEAGVGFLIGSTIGGSVGFILGWIRRLGDLFEPFILSLYTLPKIALAPLFVLWFGIGATNKIMLAALVVFFMVFFTTYQGTRQVDRDLVENARLMGARKWDVWTKIAIPYSAVWMFAGVRIGLPYALIGAIVGEFIAAEAGVGYRIKEASNFFNTAGVFAGLIVLMVISLILLTFLNLFEKWALRWQTASGVIRNEATA
jgi:ABC-type nitrate/sulfonate/bicarbonate transport system, permease component